MLGVDVEVLSLIGKSFRVEKSKFSDIQSKRIKEPLPELGVLLELCVIPKLSSFSWSFRALNAKPDW